MRGKENKQTEMLPVLSLEDLVAQRLAEDDPIFHVKRKADEVLAYISQDIDALYPKMKGRYSIPPEYLLRALLWQALFSIRSERQLITQLQFNLLCRWFVGLPVSQSPWDASTFSKNRSALFNGRLNEIAQKFFFAHLEFLRAEGYLSSDHLSVDGTQLEAWASQKSFIKKSDLDDEGNPPPPPPGGRNEWVDFKGEKRSNRTHVSVTDPDARLTSKGGGAKLTHEMSVLAENRNNFAIGYIVKSPSGTSEREAAYEMVERECEAGRKPKTIGGDKNYSNGDDLIESLDSLDVIPHFPQRKDRPNSLASLFHDEGYDLSRKKRMKIEEIMGYAKRVCGLAKVKVRGTIKVMGVAAIALSSYNLIHERNCATYTD